MVEIIDVSLSAREKAMLRQRVGTKLRSFRCDPFSFNNWVYQQVGILFDDCSMILKNEVHTADYYGADEDICWFEICEATEPEIVSALVNVQQVDIPFHEIVTDILLIQEDQKLYERDELTYHVKLTRGIVFIFEDGREIAFEKTDPFSEEIEIRRGTNLLGSFRVKNDPDEWDEGAEMIISQEVYPLISRKQA